jgi:hypothetical protein
LYLELPDEEYLGGGRDEYEEEYVIVMVLFIVRWVVGRI